MHDKLREYARELQHHEALDRKESNEASRLEDQTRKLKVELREAKIERAEIKTVMESKIPSIQRESQRLNELLEEEREKTKEEVRKCQALSKAVDAGQESQDKVVQRLKDNGDKWRRKKQDEYIENVRNWIRQIRTCNKLQSARLSKIVKWRIRSIE